MPVDSQGRVGIGNGSNCPIGGYLVRGVGALTNITFRYTLAYIDAHV